MTDDSPDSGEFLMNYDKLLEYPNIPTYIKAAVYKGLLNSYLPFEEFLRELSLEDLSSMQALFDKARGNNEEAVNMSFMISAALAQLEGVFFQTTEELREFWGTVLIGINLESLSRKGLVELNRENLSFLATDESLVKLTEAGKSITASIRNQKGLKDV